MAKFIVALLLSVALLGASGNPVTTSISADETDGIVLIIGNDRIARTDLHSFLAKNYSISIPVCDDCSEHQIHSYKDELDQSTSKSNYRELPGFDADVTNSRKEVAKEFRKMTANNRPFKILLQVDHFTVMHERSSFSTLLNEVVSLLKNVAQYEDSIGMVVTGAPFYYTWKNGKYSMESDDMIKEEVKDNLMQFRMSMEKVGTNVDLSTKLLEVLIGPQDSASALSSERIAIFRSPREVVGDWTLPGPNPIYQSERNIITRIVEENLKFVTNGEMQ